MTEGKLVLIGDQLDMDQIQQAVDMIKNNMEEFTWSYKYLKGVPPRFISIVSIKRRLITGATTSITVEPCKDTNHER